MNQGNQRRLVIGICLCAAVLALKGQEPRPLALGTSVRSALFSDFVGVLTPFHNGFRPQWERERTSIHLYDTSGKMVRDNDLLLTGVESFTIQNVAVSRSGLVAAAVQAVNSDGAIASAIALFEKPGAPERIIRTNPFIVSNVTIANDGSVWVLGGDPKLEHAIKHTAATLAKKAQLCILQKYGPDGLLAGEFLKRSSFGETRTPGQGKPLALPNGIGLLLGHDGDSVWEWLELSLAGDLLDRWKLPAVSGRLHLERVSVTDSGAVYGLWWSNTSVPGVGAYRMNKITHAWDRLTEPTIEARFGRRLNRPEFMGTDGNLLAFTISRQPAQVIWLREPEK